MHDFTEFISYNNRGRKKKYTSAEGYYYFNIIYLSF